MEEEIEFIVDSAHEAMGKVLVHLEKKYTTIRAGKASPAMLNGVMVEYYGNPTPLNQVSNINTPDGMTITVQPFEKSLITEIEKGIMIANLGFNPDEQWRECNYQCSAPYRRAQTRFSQASQRRG